MPCRNVGRSACAGFLVRAGGGGHNRAMGEGGSQRPGGPGRKRASVLQLELPCATLDEVRARHPELRPRRFLLRPGEPKALDTVVRIDATLSDGTHCFSATSIVERVHPEPDRGMTLWLVAADDSGRELVAWMGGPPPPLLKEAPGAAPPAPETPRAPGPARPPARAGLAAGPARAPPPVALAPPGRPEPPAPAPPVAPAPPPLARNRPPPSRRPAPPPLPRPTLTPGQPAQAVTPALPEVVEDVVPARPEAARKGPIIGIDLGTTNSCAAV